MAQISVQSDQEKQQTTEKIRLLARHPNVTYIFRDGFRAPLAAIEVYDIDIQEALKSCVVVEIDIISMVGRCTVIGEDLDGRKLRMIVTAHENALLMVVWHTQLA